MKMLKLKIHLDEHGVSVVLGAILILGIGIAVGSLVYSQYVQSTLHSTEAGFMNDVGGTFVKLQSSISTMGVGQWSIVNLKMNPSFPFFIPTQGEVGTLSSTPGAASSAFRQISLSIWNEVGSSFGYPGTLQNPNNDEPWTATQQIFREKFYSTDNWKGPTIVPPDNWGSAGYDLTTSYPSGDRSGSIKAEVSNPQVQGIFKENAYWALKKYLVYNNPTNLPVTLQAWLGKSVSWNDPNQKPNYANSIWRIDVENSYQVTTAPQTLYAHQEKRTLGSDNYYRLENFSADKTGTNLSVSTASTGRQLWGRFVYPLTDFNTIPASTWNVNYRSWLSVPPVYDNVSSENVYQGGTISFDNAKAADNLYENIFENDYGTAKFDNYAYVSSYAVNTGSLDNFDNQKQEGSGWSTLSMAYVSTDNNITNGTFTTNDTGWTWGRVGNDALHAWTSSGYANGGSENIYDTTKNVSGEGYIYQSLPTAIPAGSTVSLFYAWLKDYKVAVPTQQDIIVTLYKPSGATVNLDSQLGAPVAYNTWYTVNKDISSYFTENGTYQIRMRYLFTTPNTNNVEANAKFDEVRIMVNNYKLDVFENVGSIVPGDSYKVQLNFRLDNNKENFRVQVQNASNGWDNFDNVITYSGGSWTTWENNVNSSYIVNNTVRLRFVDNSGKYPLTTNLQLDYVRVKSTTNAVPDFRENVQHNITGIPSADNYQLQIGYYTTGDNDRINVYLQNFTSNGWDYIGYLKGGTALNENTFTYPMNSSNYISSGNASVRFVSSVNNNTQTSLMVDYTRVKISYTVAAQASVDILIKSDNTVRQTIDNNVALANLTSTENTLWASYSFGGYTVIGQNDYLEIDYYCNVLSAGPGGTAYLKIDNNLLDNSLQTRIENVTFGFPSRSWNTVVDYGESPIGGINGAKYWKHITSSPIYGTIDNIRVYTYAMINASGNHQATASTWVDDISLLIGPPFSDNVLIGSKQILNPEYVSHVDVTITFESNESGSFDSLYLLENNYNWENNRTDNWLKNPVSNLVENFSSHVPADKRENWSFIIDIQDYPGKYIDNNGIIWLNFLAENNTSPFELAFYYINFQVYYQPGHEQIAYIQGYYGSSGNLTFKMNLYSFPNQSYIYEDGAVILLQNNTAVMVYQPVPPLVDVKNIKDDPNNIEVDINHVALVGFAPPPITKTGYASVGIRLEDTYVVYGPTNNIPENESVVLRIKYNDNGNIIPTLDAWRNYLISRANYLNTPSENNFFYTKGFTANFWSDDNYLNLSITRNNPDGIPHILYYVYVREISFSLS
jgi:hypothetical protein